ncbi:MAG: hypothetical protein L3J96_05910, partial [Thermoplasmata archaeon]|nr:hypothetical protein [Thermoplasmata archaeon]
MRRVNRGRASGLAAIVLCFLVVLSGLVILLSRSQGKEGGQSYSTQPTLNGHTKAAAIDLALASLKLGDGPAHGTPVICRLAFPGAGQAGCG